MPKVKLVELSKTKDEPQKFPILGKVEVETTRCPINEINYDFEGCPILWLNVSNIKEAKAYYSMAFPLLSDEIQEELAISGLINKIKMAKSQQIISN